MSRIKCIIWSDFLSSLKQNHWLTTGERWLRSGFGARYIRIEAEYILNFFEMIGLLVRRGYLDATDVWNCFSYWMFNVYADLREDIEQERRDDDTYYADFCDLIERLRQIEKKEGGNSDNPSREEITDFWRDESKLKTGSPVHRRWRRKKKVKEGEHN